MHEKRQFVMQILHASYDQGYNERGLGVAYLPYTMYRFCISPASQPIPELDETGPKKNKIRERRTAVDRDHKVNLCFDVSAFAEVSTVAQLNFQSSDDHTLIGEQGKTSKLQ